jgi:hypothetical protein
MPAASSHAAARDLIHALNHPSAAAPLSLLTDGQHAALQQLAEIFQSVTKPPAIDPVPPGFGPLSVTALPNAAPVPRVDAIPTAPSTGSPNVPRVPNAIPATPVTYTT